MPLLNYTTQISAQKTVSEITALLVRAKAEFGAMTFRLPSNVDQVYKILQRQHLRVPRSLRTLEQANRVAWRIVKDWTEAQLAMIECGLVDVAQIFLPYAQDASGKTVYEHLKEQRFSEYLLSEKSQ